MTEQVSESFLRTMADAVPGLIAHWDRALRCSFANRHYAEWFGRPLAEIVGATMPSVLGEPLFTLAKPYVDAVLAGTEQRFDRIVTKADGTIVHAWVNYVPHRDASGGLCGFFVLVTDVTPLRHSERWAEDRESHYRLLADHSSDMIFHLDQDFVRRYASPACREILGFEPHELVGIRPVNQVHPDDAERVAAVFRSLVDGSRDRNSVTNRIRHKDGHWVWVEVELRSIKDPRSGTASGIVGAMRDISLRKSMETQLAETTRQLFHLARQDGLTGLLNRRGFDEILSQYHRAAREAGTTLSLIMIDVDWFKPFNDRYGHPAGDECLRRIGATITASMRHPDDRAARYGGEEFVVLLPNADEATAARMAEGIRRSVARYALAHAASPQRVVTLSAGVASTGRDTIARECGELLGSADRALYAAKKAGRNAVFRASGLDGRREPAGVIGHDRPARRRATTRVA